MLCRKHIDPITVEGSGHFRVRIYAKPEVSVIRQHAAKKQSVFHTELRSLWSIEVLTSDKVHVPKLGRTPRVSLFFPFGAAHGGEETDYQCSRLWFPSTGSPSFGPVWPIQ